MEKTVKEHLAESDRVAKCITDANALVKKLQSELERARATLEELADFQHPKLRMTPPFHLRRDRDRDREVVPVSVIERQIAAINDLLGDRA